jgi:hypothetical protein
VPFGQRRGAVLAEDDENSLIATGLVDATGLTTTRLGLWLYLVGALWEEPACAPEIDTSGKSASIAAVAARELRIAPSIGLF